MKVGLTGEYECKLDAKGRMKLPVGLLEQLKCFEELDLVVNRGYENHLMLYPKLVWEEKVKEVDALNINIKSHRQVIRYFYRGASALKIDASERVLFPKQLLGYAGIEREVVLFAYQQQIEVWDKESYGVMLNEEPMDFAQIAEQVWGDVIK